MIYRKDLNRPLTPNEVDANFRELYTLIEQKGIIKIETKAVDTTTFDTFIDILKKLQEAVADLQNRVDGLEKGSN